MHVTPRRIDKPWGHEEIWAETSYYVGKILRIAEGARLSLQHHNVKDETIRVLTGVMMLTLGEEGPSQENVILQPGDSYHISPGLIHRMVGVTACEVLEVSTPHLDDVIRHVDEYGRAGCVG